MSKRNSFIEKMEVISLISGSVVEVGDSVQLSSLSNVVAVNRETEIFYGNEGDFNAIPLFSEIIPTPGLPYVKPIIKKHNELADIKVRKIAVKGISASAILQVGNTKNVVMESRVWHQRQLEQHTNHHPIRKE